MVLFLRANIYLSNKHIESVFIYKRIRLTKQIDRNHEKVNCIQFYLVVYVQYRVLCQARVKHKK